MYRHFAHFPLREFLLTAWLSFTVPIEVSEKYETRAQLFDQTEEWKMT